MLYGWHDKERQTRHRVGFYPQYTKTTRTEMHVSDGFRDYFLT